MLVEEIRAGIFTETGIENIVELLTALKKVHTRMVIEGCSFEEGQISEDPKEILKSS